MLQECVGLLDLSGCCPDVDFLGLGFLLLLFLLLFPAHRLLALVQLLSEELYYFLLALPFEFYHFEVECILPQGEQVLHVDSAEVSAYSGTAGRAFYRLQVYEEMHLLLCNKIRRAQVNPPLRHMLLLKENMLHPSLRSSPLTIGVDILEVYNRLLAPVAVHLTAVLYFYIDPVHNQNIITSQSRQ